MLQLLLNRLKTGDQQVDITDLLTTELLKSVKLSDVFYRWYVDKLYSRNAGGQGEANKNESMCCLS